MILLKKNYMSDDVIVFKPKGREAFDLPVFEFGNGIQIEKRVWAKSEELKIGDQNLDSVKIHFLPVINDVRIGNPDEVPEDQRNSVRIDALNGLIQLAQNLQTLNIENHEPTEDFFICAATNNKFARFLVSRCGFVGDYVDGLVYITANKFCSSENISLMRTQLKNLLD
jgi:hypothetical protein